jgi:hypothetical protein
VDRAQRIENMSIARVVVRRGAVSRQTEWESSMKYMMLIYLEDLVSEQIEAGEAEPRDVESVEPWVEEMDGRGVRLMGYPLRPLAEASSVRVRGNEVLVSDGPFTETKEFIIGFDLLECKDLAEATEVASKHPLAKFGRMELRELVED